ncbi:glycoside hydrolase family 2 TIM barrel-domain containing protein [Longispora sp. K20-0274]|uniref:glycoside hydrolase family 2 protein n=1 Tax=Longispora sp. K20-0274 TaxID=3088255 RepID=UPI00399BAC17
MRLRSWGIAVAVATGLALVPAVPAGAAESVAFLSPTGTTLAGTVDVAVTAPAATTAVRFSVDGIAFAEVTRQYATATGAAPRWSTATDAGWFPAGSHTLRAEAVTPSGVVTGTTSVTTTRPADLAGVTTLNGAWPFATDDELPTGALDGAAPPGAQPGFSEAAMTTVLVPDSYGAVRDRWNTDKGHRVLYRKTLDLGALGPQRVHLVFESCFFACRYFVNGTQVGTSTGGYLPQRFDVTAAAHDGVNTLAVIVDNRTSTIGAYSVTHLYWQWGGLLQGARVERTAGVAVTNVTAEGDAAGTLTLRAQGVNTQATTMGIPAALKVTAPGGSTVIDKTVWFNIPAGGGQATPVTLTVPDPALWSPADPARYTASVVPGAGYGQPVTLRPGLRTVAVSGADVTVNGQLVSNLPGFNRHADYPGLGRTQPDGLAVRELDQLHAKGYRILRPGHYPTTPALLDEADRLGMLVVEEVSIQQMSGTALASAPLRAFAKEQLARMIDRDRGHPGVVIWSVGNENATNTTDGANYVNTLIGYGKALDPTRLYTEVSAWHTADKAYPYEDVVLANVYYGWYDHAFADVPGLLDAIQSTAGNKPVMVSEYGAEAVAGRAGTGKGTEYYQARMVDEYNRLVGHRPHTLGLMYWTSTEFQCSPTWSGGNPDPVPPFHTKALQTWFREPKLGWRVAFAPVRIRDLPAFPAPLSGPGTVTVPVTVDDVGGHGASGTLVVTPPAGFTAGPDRPFTVPAGGSVTVDVTLTGAFGGDATPGLVRAVLDADTEALPRQLVPAPGGAALALDAGTDTSPVTAGYRRLGPSTAYTTTLGYGWSGAAPQSRDRTAPDDLRRDFATDTAPRTLRVTLPAGSHTVYLLVGDNQYAADRMTVAEGGVTLVDTGAALPIGTFRWFSTTLSGGTHDLTLSATTAGTYWKLGALVAS